MKNAILYLQWSIVVVASHYKASLQIGVGFCEDSQIAPNTNLCWSKAQIQINKEMAWEEED